MSYHIKIKYIYKTLIFNKEFLKKVPKYFAISKRPTIFTM